MSNLLPARSLLLIDDDADSREMYEFAFRKAGWHVTVLSSGAAALQFVRAFQPGVVITDIRMASVTGYDVCRAVRADPGTRDVPVVALTALPLRDIDAVGFSGVLSKPCTPEALIAAVEGILETPSAVPPAARSGDAGKMLRAGSAPTRQRRRKAPGSGRGHE